MNELDLFNKFYEEGLYPSCENNSDLMDEMTIEDFKWKFMQQAFQAGLEAAKEIIKK